MSFTNISGLGFGGAGTPDVLPQAMGELQRRTLTMVEGQPANTKTLVGGMAAEDTVIAVVDMVGLVSVAVSTITAVEGGFTSTVDLNGKKLLLCWCDKFLRSTSLSYQEKVLADGATHYWRLNEVSGTTAQDSIGGAHATMFGSIQLGVPGHGGGVAMGFDLETYDAYLHVESVTLPPTFTFEGWFLMPTGPAFYGDQLLFSNRLGGPANLVVVETMGTVPRIYAGCNTMGTLGDRNFNDGLWHHVVALFETDAYIQVYVDGVVDAHAMGSMLVHTMDVGPVVFAGNDDQVNAWWNGKLADFAIYPRLLTSEEIATHYALGCALG